MVLQTCGVTDERYERLCPVFLGTSSVGSTTVFNSIAAGAFSHKRHMSPLLDMSDRSMHLQKSMEDKEVSTDIGTSKYSPRDTKSSPRDTKYSPRDTEYSPRDRKYSPRDRKYSPRDNNNKTPHDFKLQDSPRELQSQLSSATEYDTLPSGKKGQSPSIPAHLMLSPDLAQRVSDILSQSGSTSVPKLTFSSVRPPSTVESSTTSSPREYDRNKRRDSTESSLVLSQDELDKHVSKVLNRSKKVLESNEKSVENDADEDHSYLDKYMSPQSSSAYHTSVEHSSPQLKISGYNVTSPANRSSSTTSPRTESR